MVNILASFAEFESAAVKWMFEQAADGDEFRRALSHKYGILAL
jgi:hypothetical protein